MSKNVSVLFNGKRLTKKAAVEMVKNDPTMFYRPMPKKFKELFPVVTMDLSHEFGLHYTQKHTGKMAGMFSLSTTCKCNPACLDRIKSVIKLADKIDNNEHDTDHEYTKKELNKLLKDYIKQNPYAKNIPICWFCFSDSQQDRQTSMVAPLAHNYDIINNGIIHKDWIPVINVLYFRGESFGDFGSENAVINFFNIAKYNKNVSFTVWTKNLVFFKKAIEHGYKKPKNFRLVLSSMFINVQTAIPQNAIGLVDVVFTVYTREYADKFNIDINCGARSCLNCLRCYKDFNGVKIVNEELK